MSRNGHFTPKKGGKTSTSNIAARTYHVTFLPSQYAPTKTSDDLTAEQLAERIRSESGKYRSKLKLPWLKLARFGNKLSDRNCIRWDENTEAVSGCEVDYDKGDIAFDTALAVIKKAGIHAIGYTSANYVPVEKERWRLLFPFSRELGYADAKQYEHPEDKEEDKKKLALKRLRAVMVARVNGLFDGVLAPESFRLSLSYLYGAVKGKEATHRVEVIDGEFLDLRHDLDANALGENKTRKEEKTKGDDTEIINHLKQLGDESGGPHGLVEHLAYMGDGEGLHGFNAVLVSSTAAYAKEHGSGFNKDALKTLLRAAITAAPKNPDRNPADIKRYRSDKYLNETIKSAIDKFADDDVAEPEASKPQDSSGNKPLWIPPHDFWSVSATEKLRPGMVPAIIENVAFEYAERSGLDVDALVMSMLTCCSSIIPTEIKVAETKAVDNTFTESIRIWQANVAPAGAGKSPIQTAVTKPLNAIDERLYAAFKQEKVLYDKLTKDVQKETDTPRRKRVLLPTDVSVEKEPIHFAENPGEGLLESHDELIGFFGAPSRYSNKSGGGEKVGRSYQLKKYDSQHYSGSRISRDDVDCVPSSSIIGGIQPSVLHQLLGEASRHDGLVQRFNAVIMPEKMNKPNRDIEPKYPLTLYEKLINDMYECMPLRMAGATLHFSPKAEVVRDRMFDWVANQIEFYRHSNVQLALHLSKYKGMFLRYCGLFHMIEYYGDKQTRSISADTANMVYRFMTSCRLSHAKAFYAMIKQNEENDDMKNIAEFILSHGLEKVSAREIQDGSSRFNRLTTRDIAATASTMIALGWLKYIQGKRVDSHNWLVNPDVHRLFTGRAGIVRERNAKAVANIEAAKVAAKKRGQEG